MTVANYTLSIPFASNSPSADQPNMLQNTNSIAAILNVDMIGFNNSSLSGYHYKTTYVNQTTVPVGVSGADVVYATVPATPAGSLLELFLQRATGSPIQLTSGTTVTNNSVTTSSITYKSYQTFLPGGIQVKFGNIMNGSGSVFGGTVTLTSLGLTNLPTAVGVFLSGGQGTFSAPTTSQFTLGGLVPGQTGYWLMIGY